MVGSTLALPLEEKAAKLTFFALRSPSLLVSTLEPKLNNNSSWPTLCVGTTDGVCCIDSAPFLEERK